MKTKLIWALFLLVFAQTVQAQENKTNNGKSLESPVIIVDKQLEAYNNRDIEAFLATYSKDIEIYNFDGTLSMKGHDDMRKVYERMFLNTPNLHCVIKNRIVINNKVIDEENVTSNERLLHAVAVYEVENGLIKKVLFVR